MTRRNLTPWMRQNIWERSRFRSYCMTSFKTRKHSGRMQTVHLHRPSIAPGVITSLGVGGCLGGHEMNTFEQVSSPGNQMSLAIEGGGVVQWGAMSRGVWEFPCTGRCYVWRGLGFPCTVRFYVWRSLGVSWYSEVLCIMSNGHTGPPSCTEWQTDTLGNITFPQLH